MGKQLRDFEKVVRVNSIDLDVFMTSYDDEGVSLYATEKISQTANAGKRKKVFEKHGSEKKKTSIKNH